MSLLSRSALKSFLFKNIHLRLFTMNVDTGSNDHWRGVPLTELYGSQSPWGAPEFPLVAPSYNHAVLYHVPSSGCVAGDRPPKPQIGQDKWDSEHVRMPCSSHSLYPVEDSAGESHLKRRWEMIENALSKPLRNSHDLSNAIISYNTKFRNIWKFKGLHKFFDEYLEEEESQYFFDVTLPEVAKLALSLPKLVQAPIPLLKQNKNRSISLSQQQIACLLANAFFSTFPRRNSRKSNSEYASYPYINFNTYSLYEATDSDANLEKLKCICHYFRRVVTKVPVGTVTYRRRAGGARAGAGWARSRRALHHVPLHVDSRHTIEDADGLIQVDFANKFLGGGVLGHGCVQEEIRFVICPELLLSMLFTEELKANEALIIIGAERYSEYSGYGGSFKWRGSFGDETPRDTSARRRCAVLAVDALPYTSLLREFRKDNITRELNKAWIGFSFDTDPQSSSLQYPGVATGNWGCGAFGGTPHLKSLLQLMACAEAGRPMAYYTFSDDTLRDDIINMYNLLARHNVTVGQLYKHIINFSENRQNVVKGKLHAYLEQVLKGVKPPSPSHEDDKMETSVTETIPETVLELESGLKDSPDLFSQDEMDQCLLDTAIKMEEVNRQTDSITEKQSNTQVNNKAEVSICRTRQPTFDTKRKIEDSSNSLVSNKLLATNKHTSRQDNDQSEENNSDNMQSLLDTIQRMEEGTMPSAGVTADKQNSKKDDEQTLNTRQSLFDTMQKMDEEPNSTVSSPLLGNQSKNVSINDSNLSMECGQRDRPTSEMKKKTTKKITDYFSKKST
ncbi:unnamed protein product [Arctia plantaginis]|uniref:poly(ADP-ribose) glycohydrolase n=1 Tax=Arctia plantaginis TaxID=874455 RepID=A0A8S1ARM9_ARCPL|nr:unnamed protein product [Arctia plantaginis]CAB3247394.1 unnamed protein product [Arctia plantaginis]